MNKGSNSLFRIQRLRMKKKRMKSLKKNNPSEIHRFEDSADYNFLTSNDYEDSLMLNQLYDNDQFADISQDDPI